MEEEGKENLVFVRLQLRNANRRGEQQAASQAVYGKHGSKYFLTYIKMESYKKS